MTLHLDQRMNHRGIKRSLLDLTLTHGTWDGDRCVLDRKAIQSLLDDCDNLRRTALQAMDKGGMVVVEAGGREITSYSIQARKVRKH